MLCWRLKNNTYLPSTGCYTTLGIAPAELGVSPKGRMGSRWPWAECRAGSRVPEVRSRSGCRGRPLVAANVPKLERGTVHRHLQSRARCQNLLYWRQRGGRLSPYAWRKGSWSTSRVGPLDSGYVVAGSLKMQCGQDMHKKIAFSKNCFSKRITFDRIFGIERTLPNEPLACCLLFLL
jgi:hypothetical protein